MDCGGKAQRRHRFGSSRVEVPNPSKAVWRYASRRTPGYSLRPSNDGRMPIPDRMGNGHHVLPIDHDMPVFVDRDRDYRVVDSQNDRLAVERIGIATRRKMTVDHLFRGLKATTRVIRSLRDEEGPWHRFLAPKIPNSSFLRPFCASLRLKTLPLHRAFPSTVPSNSIIACAACLPVSKTS